MPTPHEIAELPAILYHDIMTYVYSRRVEPEKDIYSQGLIFNITSLEKKRHSHKKLYSVKILVQLTVILLFFSF